MKKYIYLGLIFALSIFLTFFLIELYKDNFIKEETSLFVQKPYNQIKVVELKNYLEENPRINILLIENIDKEVEKQFNNFITQNKTLEHFIVINNKELSKGDVNYLKSITQNNVLIDYTNKISKLLIISNKNVIDYLEFKENANSKTIESFVENYEDFND